ncbi:MAG: SDR family oxidoreductase [Deltaproteobacteria bacterium]|nr:SDR family oxidoreductase [Deltaproteobacteria bacterium]
MKFNPDFWAIIIGGSSGFGLATAEKLAAHGMNLCIVHRDRRGSMSKIEPCFEKLRSTGVSVLTFNLDGLSVDGRTRVLDALATELGNTGRVRMLLHAVAFGNLKLLVPHTVSDAPGLTRKKIAQQADIAPDVFDRVVGDAFENGADCLHALVDPPEYNTRQFLGKEDFARTIQAMGFNIVEWVADIFERKFFAKDARVLSLTSEGNSVAWRGYAAVAAAKAVLESVSRAMAVEFAPYGLRSNIIQAGVTDTAALRAIPGNRHIKARAGLRNPFGRLTTPEDVANVIFLLCLDEAAWINGALICADGGERIS